MYSAGPYPHFSVPSLPPPPQITLERTKLDLRFASTRKARITYRNNFHGEGAGRGDGVDRHHVFLVESTFSVENCPSRNENHHTYSARTHGTL